MLSDVKVGIASPTRCRPGGNVTEMVTSAARAVAMSGITSGTPC
ncbi:hypothetical protein ACFSVJ_27535 [Prauserella oleivorans]